MSPTGSPVAERDAAFAARRTLAVRHLVFGWWTLLLFLTTGIVLEGLHGLKIGYYLDVANATRRLMWTLGHAHGTLLSLVSLAFAAATAFLRLPSIWIERVASPCLLAANVLMPLGFFLGGLYIYAGDPGLGIVLVPLGALLLLSGVLLTACHIRVKE